MCEKCKCDPTAGLDDSIPADRWLRQVMGIEVPKGHAVILFVAPLDHSGPACVTSAGIQSARDLAMAIQSIAEFHGGHVISSGPILAPEKKGAMS